MLKARLSESVQQSPMRLIEDHMQLATRAAEELLRFMVAAQAGDWSNAEKLQQLVADYERDADALKQEVRHTLPKRLWMPVARVDLLALVSAQDKIANVSKDISGLMLGRRMAFPQKLEKGVLKYAEQSLQTVSKSFEAVKGTNDLFRSGFGGNQAKDVEKLILDIERLERRSDAQQQKLRSRLHKLEAKLEPVDVMFMYQLLVWLGSLADRAENVGHRLTLIINA